MQMALLRVTAAVACVPLAALLLMVGLGAAAPLPALAAAAAIVIAALGLALIWTHDMRVLGAMLHRVGVADPSTIPSFYGNLALSPQLLGEVALVSQTLGEREAELDRLRRAEESI